MRGCGERPGKVSALCRVEFGREMCWSLEESANVKGIRLLYLGQNGAFVGEVEFMIVDHFKQVVEVTR